MSNDNLSPDFSIIADAAFNITEIMCLHKVTEFSNEIGKIYSAITDNSFLFSKCEFDHKGVPSEFRSEMMIFIDNRIKFMMYCIINKLVDTLKLDQSNIMKSSDTRVKIIHREFDTFADITLRELQLIEFDIAQLIKVYEHSSNTSNHFDENQNLPSNTLPDMRSILTFLIGCFRVMTKMNDVSPRTTNSVKLLKDINEDTYSTRSIITLAHLITSVALSIVKVEYSYNYVAIKEAKESLVKEDYIRYINIGSISLSSILCCFKNPTLLPLGVISKSGYLSTVEKVFLLNILVLSKLL